MKKLLRLFVCSFGSRVQCEGAQQWANHGRVFVSPSCRGFRLWREGCGAVVSPPRRSRKGSATSAASGGTSETDSRSAIRRRARIATPRGRTTAAEYGDPGVELRPLQTIGASTIERGLHEPAGELRFAATSDDTGECSASVLASLGERHPSLDQNTHPRDTHLETSSRLPRVQINAPPRNKTRHNKSTVFIRPRHSGGYDYVDAI